MTNEQKQCLLHFLGYYVGSVDGIWGTLSQTAAVAFQKDFRGIAIDKYAGKETQKALQHAVAYGMPAKNVATDKNVGDKEEDTDNPYQHWWEEIEHFEREEFACQCGKYHAPYCNGFPAEPREDMVRICEKVRKHFNAPVTIISGLRCQKHNASEEVKGVANSQHMYGEAADIYVRGVAPSAVEAFLDTIGGVRYHYTISGSNNVHFDVPMGAR
jgi:peptidoglycan hydrolase-like protein with peptidoglycan-binding domain